MTDIKYFDAPHPLCLVPKIEKKGVSFHDCTEGYYMAFVPSVSLSEFDGYREVLRSCGFELILENVMRDNIFNTYRNADGISVYAYRIGHSAEMRLVVADNAPLPPAKKEYVKVCEPFVAQLNCGSAACEAGGGLFYEGAGRADFAVGDDVEAQTAADIGHKAISPVLGAVYPGFVPPGRAAG